MIRLALVVVPLIALAGCRTENPAFCRENPGEQGCPPDGSVGGSCNMSTDCKNPLFPVCNTEKAMCTQCFGAERGVCTGVTPRCEVDTCVACADDTADCGVGGLCLPSGACAAADSILHVTLDNASTNSDCGTAGKAPCTLETALMLAMTMPARTVIKLDQAGTYTPANSNFVVDANVTIDMRAGAVLRKKDDGPILEIKSNRTVTLLGGTIEGATGSTGDGILCNGNLTVIETTIRMADRSGINAASGSLTVTHANIHDTGGGQFVAGIVSAGNSITISRSSLISNRGGGIAVNAGTFIIVGNALLDNGDNTNSAIGGISITASSNPTNRLDFNTIASNKVQDGGNGGGINCNAGSGFVGHNNIIWNNKEVNLLGTILSQISGGCRYDYSVIGPRQVLEGADGGHNLNMDPLLVNQSSDPHLPMNSPAIGAADPDADLTGIAAQDIDGDARVAPLGQGADIGADQYTAP